MTCSSCKGTKKIQLLHSFVDCTDCAPASENKPFDDRLAAFEKAVDDVQTRRQNSIARGLIDLEPFYEAIITETAVWLIAADEIHLGNPVEAAGHLTVKKLAGGQSVGTAVSSVIRMSNGKRLVAVRLD